jgi:uncharacterized delta-60 repeat protein
MRFSGTHLILFFAVALSGCSKFPGTLIVPPQSSSVSKVLSLSLGDLETLYNGECNSTPVQLQDETFLPVRAEANLTVNLSSDGGALFYTDALCTTPLSTVTLPISAISVSVFTKPVAIGSLVLTAVEAAGTATKSQVAVTVLNPAVLLLSDNPGLDYGSVATTSSVTHTFTLTNSGGSLADLVAASALSAPFSFLGGTFPGTGATCSTSLNPGASCSIKVEFSPTAIASYSGELSLSYQNGNSVQSTSRSLTGVGLGVPLNLLLSGSVSQVTGACAAFTVSSVDANSSPSNVSAPLTVNLSGAGAGGFYSDAGCSATIATVAITTGNSSATFYYTNASTAAVVLQASDAGAVLTTATLGLSVSNAAFLTISDGPSYSFGSIAQGTTRQHTFTLSNGGLTTATSISAPALPSSYAYTGGVFPGTGGTCGTSLSASASCTFKVTYQPATSGWTSTSISIIYNDGSAVNVVARAISGTSIGSPTRVTITGGSSINATLCYAYTITSTDSGGSAVNATTGISIALTGKGGGGFFSNAGCSTAISSASISTGASTATFYFSDATAENLTFLATPSGGLTSGSLAVSVLSLANLSFTGGTSYNYMGEDVGSAITRTFTLTNNGQVAATGISPAGLSSPFSFAGGTFPGTTGTCTTTILPSASCTMEIRFSPLAATTYTNTLLVPYENGASLSVLSLSLSGLGVTPTATFKTARGFNNSVTMLAMAPDGVKVIAVGNFTLYDTTPINRIARFNADMTLDTSFNSGGTGANSTISGIVPIGDGTAGYYLYGSLSNYNGTGVNPLIRITSSGALDTSFVSPAITSSSIASLVVVDRGAGVHQVYISGSFTTVNGTPAVRIARLNSDGSLDTSFVTGTGFDGTPFSLNLAPGSSPRVYAVGSISTYNSTSIGRIVALDDTGAIDTSFAPGSGMSGLTISSSSTYVAPDGKIYVGGNFSQFSGVNKSGIVRLNTDGSIDSSFTASLSTSPGVTSIRPVGTELVVVGPTTANGFNVPRIAFLSAATGALISYPLNNTTVPNAGMGPPAIATDGTMYLGGSFTTFGGEGHNRFAVLTPARALDTSIASGAGVSATTAFSVTSMMAMNDDSNRIYVGGGTTSFNGSSVNFLLRLKPDTTLDTSFGTGTGFDGLVRTMIQDSSGKLYIGGDFQNYRGSSNNRIAALLPNGNANPAFSAGSGFDNIVYALALQPGGSGIYVGGSFTGYQSSSVGSIIRLSSDGTPDVAFSTGTGFNGLVRSIAAVGDATNDIYVAGSFTSYNGTAAPYIIRLKQDGSINTAFNPGTGFNNAQTILKVIPDGSGTVYVGGTSTTYQGTASRGLARLLANGNLDSSFPMASSFTGGTPTVSALELADDNSGDVYVGGTFSAFSGSSPRLVRLNSNGTHDTAFATGTSVFDGTVFTILMSPTGTHSVYVGGSFTGYQNKITDQMFRLLPDGTLD